MLEEVVKHGRLLSEREGERKCIYIYMGVSVYGEHTHINYTTLLLHYTLHRNTLTHMHTHTHTCCLKSDGPESNTGVKSTVAGISPRSIRDSTPWEVSCVVRAACAVWCSICSVVIVVWCQRMVECIFPIYRCMNKYIHYTPSLRY